ncbi:MAG: DinB family protein [Dehalococcoidia bacterium]
MNTTSETIRIESTERREALRNEIERTRQRFHAVAEQLAEGGWRSKPKNSGWTAGQHLVHLAWALGQLPKEVESARKGKGMFNLPKWIADPASYWYCKWSARKATPESVVSAYDAAIDATLHALNLVKESEWELGADFYGEGFKSIADLFREPSRHFAQHTAGFAAQ